MEDREPLALRAGESASWRKALPDYTPGAGWALKYRVVGEAVVEFTATADGEAWLATLTAVQTGTLNTGTAGASKLARLFGYAEKGAERVVVYENALHVHANPTTLAAGSDTRSHARKVLEAIEATIEGRATSDQVAYTIQGRSLQRFSAEELLRLRASYRAAVAREEARDAAAAGRATGRRILVRF